MGTLPYSMLTFLFIDSVDTQVMSLPELGDLRKVRVLHDNSGDDPSWFLDKVIYNLQLIFDLGIIKISKTAKFGCEML